jgi:hypothetical protein
MIDCDVLVAGGGVSGVAAAVSAARGGCRVVLIEKNDALGGAGTRGMLRAICGLYLNGGAEPTATLNAGIAREIVAQLGALSPHRTIQRIGKVFVLPYASVDLEEALVSLCRNETDLTVLPGSTAFTVARESGRISEVAVVRNGVQQSIRPQAVIDCTGNGEIGFMAGAEFDLAPPDEIQMAGYTVRLRGLQGRDQALAVKVPYVLAEAVKNGGLSTSIRFTAFSAGDGPDDGFLKFSAEGMNSTEREQRMQEDVLKAMRILTARLPSFQGATIVGTSAGVLDREGRRIQGEYILTEKDVLNARKFSDGIVKNSWPIELWDRSKGTIYRYVPAGDYYEIPFRCLNVKGFHNLLTAGRCISVTHQALGSVRVMGTCMALGDVAGRAAAGLIKTGRYPDFTRRENRVE